VEHPYQETLEQCPICGGRAFTPSLAPTDHTVSKKQFQLTDCTACGARFTNPRPTPAEIGKYYASEDYISHTNTSRGLQDRIYQWVRKRAIRNKHQLIAQHHPQGSILDVGCGTGEFLGFLKSKGYQTQGVEPSLTAREQAIRNHALEIMPELDQVAAHEQFNVITLWHVLEHVHDVRETLRKLHARLQTGGSLVIAVPDRDSWDAGFYGKDWAAYDVPRHLSHFRRRDMHRLLREQGFIVQRTKGMWFDAPYVCMLSEKHKGAGPLRALGIGALVGAVSNLVAALTPRPTSSSLYVASKA
jgi:2-polyprenyl-3-methyl-5-hydroxy-6-metoxy-1,4-benzoquinol methylase